MKRYLVLAFVLCFLVGCGAEPEPTRRTHQVTLKLSGSVESIVIKAKGWWEGRQVLLP